VSDKDAALLTIVTPFTEKSGMGLTISNTRSISHYWEVALDRREPRRPAQGADVQFDEFLGDEFCGRQFDESFIADLPPGVDACGENGEFHTFVYDGPLLQRPVEFALQGRSEYVAPPQFGSQRYCFANLE